MLTLDCVNAILVEPNPWKNVPTLLNISLAQFRAVQEGAESGSVPVKGKDACVLAVVNQIGGGMFGSRFLCAR